MANLRPKTNLPGSSTSSLIRSANSLQNQITAYQDSLQSFQYANSAFTDEAYSSYKDYLTSRINTLSSTGTVTDAQKALTLTKTLESATHQNISASITRENIQIMGGNATKQDKLQLIGQQFQRALANGDMTLAQSLESQYYSLSQQIQYEAQQSAQAAATLRTANATSNASDEGAKATNLTDSLKYFKEIGSNASQSQMNAAMKKFVQDNKDTFQALGVHIATDQPNYFDVVAGLVGAAYNHKVLQAQAEMAINPLQAKDYAMQAADMINGQKFDTLAGQKTFSEVQMLSQDPNAVAWDSATGTYKTTTQIGYQYENQIVNYDNSGNPVMGKVLAPVYSGIVGGAQSSRVYFLTPNETKIATNLGLNFTQSDVNKEVGAGHQVGVGVEVQASDNTPDWLKNILGKGGVTKLYTDQNGNIAFAGASSSGQGNSYYTLVQDGNGLSGLFEHTIDGTTKLAGGDYGFNAGAAQLLINQAQTVQHNIALQQQMQAAELKLSQPAPLPQISVPAPTAPPQNISVPRAPTPAARAIVPQIIAPQRAAPVQAPAAVNLQGSSFNLQGSSFRLQ